MKTTPITVDGIAAKVRDAINRTNAFILEDRKKPRQGKREMGALVEQMRGILVAELSSLGLFPEDAYEKIYQYSVEKEDEAPYAEELLFLEHCIR